MTNEEAKKFLAAQLECKERYAKRYTDGCDNDCENCELCYVQGNMREQIEALRVAIKSLEQKPVVKGKWIYQYDSFSEWNGITFYYKCSECGRQIETPDTKEKLLIDYPYCRCGAKMEVADK